MEKADIHHGEKKDHISSCSQSNFMFMWARLKRNSFSILFKSRSTKYKKNVKTIKCADVFWYVHLRLSTLEWHHQVHLYKPCSKN
jgi:hypothetical protein